ncbi:MAG: peptidoglycan DD-metalloendopeptidase family protein, partial [Firmicutes bacterium]|nr:peptidoglycan DD-metalloendopeptidase family protein [Bacillota bacterium]
ALSSFTISAFAFDENGSDETTIQFTENDLHALVQYDEAVENGHISRMNDEEELNTLVFKNKDDTRTMYYYSENIKYVDGNGVIQDKTNFITRDGDKYINADNDINVSLPVDAEDIISDGISLAYGDIEISMQPNVSLIEISNENISGISITEEIENSKGISDSVTYDNVFGSGINLRYTPTYSGVKEEIILTGYTDTNTFDFVISTNGLYLIEQNGVFGLSYEDNGELIAELSDIYVYDSNGLCTFGNIQVTEIEEHDLYEVTVCVDESFLTNMATAYPVVVDPTISFYSYIGDKKYIQDATLCGQYPTTKYGSATTLSISSSSDSYVVLRFPSFTSTNYYSLMSLGGIISANLCFHCPYKGSSAYIFAYKYTPSSSWTETSITYSNGGVNCSTDIMNVTASPSTGDIKISVTDNVKSWISAPEGASSGILLKFTDSIYSSSGYSYTFYSTEYSGSKSKPYLAINYSTTDILVHIKNLSTSNYLTYLKPSENSSTEPYLAVSNSVSDTALTDVFRLVYDSDTNGYKIGSLKQTYGYDETLNSSLQFDSSGEYWDLVYYTSGYFRIKNQTTSKYLKLDGSTVTTSSTVSTAANWSFEAVDSYTITINVQNTSGQGISVNSDIVTLGNTDSRQVFKISGGSKTIRVLDTTCGIGVGSTVDKGTKSDYARQYSEIITSSCTLSFTMHYKTEYPSFSVFPVDQGDLSRITSQYGYRYYESGSTELSLHKGIDMYLSKSTADHNIYSVSNGEVVYVSDEKTDGYRVIISYNDGEYFFAYDHMYYVNVAKGDTVTANKVIGKIGEDGKSYSNHLHFEVYTGSGTAKTNYDPAVFLSYFR